MDEDRVESQFKGCGKCKKGVAQWDRSLGDPQGIESCSGASQGSGGKDGTGFTGSGGSGVIPVCREKLEEKKLQEAFQKSSPYKEPTKEQQELWGKTDEQLKKDASDLQKQANDLADPVSQKKAEDQLRDIKKEQEWRGLAKLPELNQTKSQGETKNGTPKQAAAQAGGSTPGVTAQNNTQGSPQSEASQLYTPQERERLVRAGAVPLNPDNLESPLFAPPREGLSQAQVRPGDQFFVWSRDLANGNKVMYSREISSSNNTEPKLFYNGIYPSNYEKFSRNVRKCGSVACQ